MERLAHVLEEVEVEFDIVPRPTRKALAVVAGQGRGSRKPPAKLKSVSDA
jgi:hypothetical protein